MQSTQRKITSLKFKGKPTDTKKQHNQKIVQKEVQNTQVKEEMKKQQMIPQKIQNSQNHTNTKTLAEKSFEIVKKRRIIQKAQDKTKITNRQRIQKLHKTLSKQSDHYDLAKIGEKIQKGY